MKRLALGVALVIALPFAAPRAQSQSLTGAALLADSAARLIDRGHIENDLDKLHSARALLDRALTTYPKDPLLLHYKGYAAFREGEILYVRSRASEAQPLLEMARTMYEQSDSIQPMAENDALLTAVLGYLIGADNSRGPELGPMIMTRNSRALSLGPLNPRVMLILGIGKLFTPPEYGGGASEAEKDLSTAVRLFDADHPPPPLPSWGRAEAYAWLGQALQREGKTAEAKTAFDKALALEPNYGLVKNMMTPSVAK
jgi:tetratricopeptide (TPR) repeat protein